MGDCLWGWATQKSGLSGATKQKNYNQEKKEASKEE